MTPQYPYMLPLSLPMYFIMKDRLLSSPFTAHMFKPKQPNGMIDLYVQDRLVQEYILSMMNNGNSITTEPTATHDKSKKKNISKKVTKTKPKGKTKQAVSGMERQGTIKR